MSYYLYDAINEVLDRLSDLDEKIWRRDEIEMYVKDGYDQFIRNAKPLFDWCVIENLPPAGNWQTDLERYYASQRPGWGLTDEPFHVTDNWQPGMYHGSEGRYGGSYATPTGLTSPGDRHNVTDIDGKLANGVDAVPVKVPGGRLPDSVTDLLRLSFNRRTLVGLGSEQARKLDPAYETRGTGYPQFFTWDKDGLMFLRVIPAMAGVAPYWQVNGSWGTMTYSDDDSLIVETTESNGKKTGGFGILRFRGDMVPAQGPWGTPTRIHPTDLNTRAEVYRLGLNLDEHPFELPHIYIMYCLYWAMARALRRDGPGQDLELAAHYEERYSLGLMRCTQRRSQMQPERIGRFHGIGPIGAAPQPFGLGDPQPPYPYGTPDYGGRI